MKTFSLIGAAGYIAPRHMKAIKDTGNQLLAAFDPYDGVGIMDSHFPEASFFTEFERFDRHLEKLRRTGQKIDYVSICSPNYLHDAHIRFGLRVGADVICEKPLVLNPWNVDALQEMEHETGKKVNTILQLRLHPAIISLKEEMERSNSTEPKEVLLTYLTSRGNWYYTSWKGDLAKSGGIATNIGVHFFDMLAWIFGTLRSNEVHVHTHDRAAGHLEFEKANVRWFLSINEDTLPDEAKKSGKRTFRSLQVDGREIEFSDGFTDLHTDSYRQIIEGKGFGLEAARPAIETVHAIRSMPISRNPDREHPMASLPLSRHPFDR